MNEEQWLSSTDPSAMLFALRPTRPIQAEGGNPGHSDRQLRLFCCACCRVNDTPNRHVEECEREGMLGVPDAAWASSWARVDTRNVSQAAKAAILRDIIGNPFRPVNIWKDEGMFALPTADILGPTVEVRSCPWLSRDVETIARSIYDDRRFEDMPILADALMDAGCHDEAVLNHCRGLEWCSDCFRRGIAPSSWNRECHRCPECDGGGWRSTGPHVRGCWLLDLILGNE